MINKQNFRLKKDGTPYKGCICRTPELIENYQKAIEDTTQTWYCHHRLETHTSDGERRSVDLESKELIALGMYFDRSPEELIFLTQAEHTNLHKKGKPKSEDHKKKIAETEKGKTISEETRKKLSESHKGKPSPKKGKHTGQVPWNKGKHHSEETRKKMAEAKKDRHWKLVGGKRVWY